MGKNQEKQKTSKTKTVSNRHMFTAMVELLKQLIEEIFPFLFYILMTGTVITHIIPNLEDVFRYAFRKILIMPSDYQSSPAVTFLPAFTSSRRLVTGIQKTNII